MSDSPRAPPPRTPSQTLSPDSQAQSGRITPTPLSIQSNPRSSFSESRQHSRFVPPSPRMRSQRQPSLGQASFQDLLNNPPLAHESDGAFTGRDWKTIKLSEIIDPGLVRWAEFSTSVEDATHLLIDAGSPNAVLIRRDPSSRVALSTFDYGDLNAYLLFNIGVARSGDGIPSDLIQKAKDGKTITIGDIQGLGQKEELVTLPETANLTEAVVVLGSGIHRIIVQKEGSEDVVGVLTQVRLVKFFWEQGRHFQAVHDLFQKSLRDLGVGPRVVLSVNGDKPLIDALTLMANESISSLPVLDHQGDVIGNISQVDTKLLTTSASIPLLKSSCIHFISVILNERGVNDGKDSFPVFYVNPFSTLAHTLAKLVATRSHRMWIVDVDSPTPPTPTTPAVATAAHAPHSVTHSAPTHGPPFTPTSGVSVSAASLPGQHTSGRLTGVISLTDVLNLFARASGLRPLNPDEARRRRRSSSGASLRASMESSRSSVDVGRSGGSISGRR